MADFSKALASTLKAEGGYSNDPDDPGGETYRGISRIHNPIWPGWTIIDQAKNSPGFPLDLEDNDELAELVSSHYQSNYWDRIRGDEIADQEIAEAIFDFAVNAGPRTSTKLAQSVAGAPVDGIVGPHTLEKLNHFDRSTFLALFALARIGRYVHLCETNRKYRKYFFGWVKRTLEGV
jgi:lysozyme family protein